MENILSNDGGYLRLMNSPIKINKQLPKWQILEENKVVDVPGLMSLDNFLSYNKNQFNIYLGERANRLFREDHKFNMSNLSFDTVGGSSAEETGNFIIRTVKRHFRKWLDSDKDAKEEEVFEMNIFEFFDHVKTTSKENQSQYAIRIEPYMIALKRAHDMGQQALADKLTAELFNHKYESILFAEGFHYKITEEQVVDFVKKTEKGVRLCYVENFVNPIPKEVIEMKLKADELLVFDNYVIMFYDPDLKSYKMTKKEEDELRRKKSDPILFGVISGSRNLYYITDWIDSYCDLTLDEFINVSGIDKEKLAIDEKIKI